MTPGMTCEVVDLYAIKFDPVFSRDDYSFFAHESVPPELFDETELRESMVAASGGPIRRYVARRWLRDKVLPELRRDRREAAAEGRARTAGEGRRGRRSGVHCADLLDELPGHPARLDRARLHLRLRLHDDQGGLAAGRAEREAAAAAAQEGADHDADLLPRERLSRLRLSVRRSSGSSTTSASAIRGSSRSSTSTSTRLAPSTTRPGASTCSRPTGSVTSSSPASSRQGESAPSGRLHRKRLREV